MTYQRTGGLNRQESVYIENRKRKLLEERKHSLVIFYKDIIEIEKQVWKQVWIERILKRKISINEYDRIMRTAFTTDIARLFQ